MKTSCRRSHAALSVRRIIEIHFNVSECTEFLLSLVKVEILRLGYAASTEPMKLRLSQLNWRWAPRSNERNRWPLDYNFGKFRVHSLPFVSNDQRAEWWHQLVYWVRISIWLSVHVALGMGEAMVGGREAMWLCHTQARASGNKQILQNGKGKVICKTL